MKYDRTEIHQAAIEKYTHDGRGIAVINGKTTFIRGAMANEVVKFNYNKKHSRYDEGQAIEIIRPSPDRVTCQCPHTQICGGCQIQHMDSTLQINLKQQTLAEQFKHFGQVEIKHWLPPMRGPIWGYRQKARLSVKHVKQKNKVLVGFHEINGRFVADIHACAALHPKAANLMLPLSQLIQQLSCIDHIPQIELAVAEPITALVFRHLLPFSPLDHQLLIEFAQQHQLSIYLQPKNLASVHKFWPKDNVELLSYQHSDHNITLQFHPTDFTQVNFAINRKLVNLTIQLLELNENDKVLDLFCGLGNFSLPIARYCQHVTGIEGNESMVIRAQNNAIINQLSNVTFISADLNKDFSAQAWAQQRYDKILIDPPRCGAEHIVTQIAQFMPKKIIYISCNPATLARDAGLLKQQGYQIEMAGVMDMFPHTKHVESIAVFVPCSLDKRAVLDLEDITVNKARESRNNLV